jgi:hypothetical protein
VGNHDADAAGGLDDKGALGTVISMPSIVSRMVLDAGAVM